MRRTVRLAVVLVGVAVIAGAGCITRWVVYPESRANPKDTFTTIRAAILAGKPVVLHKCLSPTFKERRGIGGVGTFRIAFEEGSDEFAGLSYLVEDAETGEPRYGVSEDGYRIAFLPVTARGRTVELAFVELPTFSARVAFPGYPAERVDYRGPCKRLVTVADGELRVTWPLDPELGLAEGSDLEEARFHADWLLLEILET